MTARLTRNMPRFKHEGEESTSDGEERETQVKAVVVRDEQTPIA